MANEIFQLREEILREHSKDQRTRIVNWVGTNQHRFNQLFHFFLQDENTVAQRAAWALSYCVEMHPGLVKHKLGLLIANLQKPALHDAVKRNSLRILQFVDIPKKYHGQAMDTCFRLVAAPREAVAIKAFSLAVLGRLATIYPEIVPEIKLLMTQQLPNHTPAFKSKARHLLKAFGQL